MIFNRTTVQTNPEGEEYPEDGLELFDLRYVRPLVRSGMPFIRLDRRADPPASMRLSGLSMPVKRSARGMSSRFGRNFPPFCCCWAGGRPPRRPPPARCSRRA